MTTCGPLCNLRREDVIRTPPARCAGRVWGRVSPVGQIRLQGRMEKRSTTKVSAYSVPPPTKIGRSKKAQYKARGSPAPSGQTTPPRNAGRDKGLRDFEGVDDRWSDLEHFEGQGWWESERFPLKPA